MKISSKLSNNFCCILFTFLQISTSQNLVFQSQDLQQKGAEQEKKKKKKIILQTVSSPRDNNSRSRLYMAVT